jgi:uncharacterized protein (DUF924 family)
MEDQDIERVLQFWFSSNQQDALKIDSRMNRWFGNDQILDRTIQDEFGELVNQASSGELMDWAETPRGRLALIILLDQFRRNIFRGTADAYKRDHMAVKICIEGTSKGDYKKLSPEQRIFFFMPLQHAESLKIQEKSVQIYAALAERVSDTLKETFLTTAQFAELHRDIIKQFGRFPHRNNVLGRQNSEEESTYLSGGRAPSFGQSSRRER